MYIFIYIYTSAYLGCNQGCIFCATGKMGLVRNLTAEEILSQVYWAKQSVQRHSMHTLTNIVFMGMGDIGINLDAVSSAIAVLVDKDRFGFSSRKVRVGYSYNCT